MKDPNNIDVDVNYNGDDEDHNNPGDLTPEAARLLTQLLTRRGFRQLVEAQQLQPDSERAEALALEWEDTLGVARDDRSQVA